MSEFQVLVYTLYKMTQNPAIVFLCTEAELTRERRGYFKALSQQISVACLPALANENHQSIENIIPADIDPVLIVHPDAYPRRLPQGLANIQIPTACFSIDTYEFTQARIRFSMLFDYAFVFHPSYDLRFQKAGHPKAVCLAHAVEADVFNGAEMGKIYDVGWVGRLDGKKYTVRRRCIEQLKSQFQMNDTERFYNPEEMATVYKQSKIVVNLSRDDYPQDANLRCFEAMASGALLITPKPTELAELGFVEGVHYVGYQHESEIRALVQYNLEHEAERNQIALAARRLVLESHTYDARAHTMLELITQSKGQLFAPARSWKPARIQKIYVEYFARSLMIGAAFKEFAILREMSWVSAFQMLPLLIKFYVIYLKSIIM